MVGSLKWLTHEPSQAPDLLYQTNAVIRRLLGAGQIELAGKAAGSIPTETMTRVVRAWREEDAGETSLPGGSVKEHLALKVRDHLGTKTNTNCLVSICAKQLTNKE